MSLNPEMGFYQSSVDADLEMDNNAQIDVEDFVEQEESPAGNNTTSKEER